MNGIDLVMHGQRAKQRLLRVTVLGPRQQGQLPPAIVFWGRFDSEAEAFSCAFQRALEEWGQATAARSVYWVVPVDAGLEGMTLRLTAMPSATSCTDSGNLTERRTAVWERRQRRG